MLLPGRVNGLGMFRKSARGLCAALRRNCANFPPPLMLHQANAPEGWADALEKGRIVHFARCPIELPPPEDQEFLRQGLAPWLRKKNVSFYPSAGKLAGMRAPAA